ncbi:hypothetical protein KA405_06660 [Patescibacteria group bacterium]|nr:hypothetical protein [Patescibacteria group bacterium]
MDDNNTRVVLLKRFADEPILICLGVCFHDLKKVMVKLLKKMGNCIKNIMEALQIKHYLTTMEKKKRIGQVSEDIH